MPKPPPFPSRIEDLHANFLATALGAPVTEFTSTRIGASRGMLGEIFLLNVGDRRVVAKFAALREGSLASAKRGRTHERELRFYEDLLGETPVRAPEFIGAWYDPDTAHFLLLQEAIRADTSVDQIAGISIAQAKLVVTEMATFHAHWWHDARLNSLDWLPRLDSELRVNNLTALAKAGWPQLVEMLGDDMPTVSDGFGESLPGSIEAALVHLGSLPPTVVHSDLRADNLLFDPDEPFVTIIDWQGCGVGPAAFDLAYFLVQSLTVDDRRAHEAELIDHWVAALQERGLDVDRHTSLAGYEQALWYGMAIACALPVISDPTEQRSRDLAATVTRRSLAALHDHG